MSVRVAVGIVTAISLLACGGCDRTTGKSLESTPEFQQIKTLLDESQKVNEQLKQDAKKLDISLKQAESKLAEETKAKSGLQTQVQDLTALRTSLEAKVDELGRARVSLEANVNDLQKTVESLTKARDAALEDAQCASEGRGAERQGQGTNPADYGLAGANQDDSVLPGAVAAEATVGRNAAGVRSSYPFVISRGSRPSSIAVILFTRR